MAIRYAAIILLVASLYANSLGGSWHYDDEHCIVRNEAIRGLENIPRFFSDLSAFTADPAKTMYRPVLLVSFAVNYAISGLEVWSWHVGNIAIHAANSCMVGWIGARLVPGGWIAGLLFAAHPLATEPTNYISSRSDSLMAFFWLLSLILWMQERYRWVYLTFFLALLTKESAATLPGVLVLYRWMSGKWHLRPLEWPRIVDLGLGAILILYLHLLVSTGFLGRSLHNPARNWWAQGITAVSTLPYYAGLLLAPFWQSVEHAVWPRETIDGYVAACLLVVGWLVAIPWMWKKDRLWVFLGAWIVLTMLPVLVMPLNIVVNERRLYLPSAAFCIGLMYLFRHDRRTKRIVLTGLLAIYSCLTVLRNPVWQSEFTLWQDAISKGPMPRSYIYLGNAWKDQAVNGNDPQLWVNAAKNYQTVVDYWPNSVYDYRALNNLGSIYFTLKDYDRAEYYYQQAMTRDDQYADVWANLGNILWVRALTRPPQECRFLLRKAISMYVKAIELDPAQVESHTNLASLWQVMGDPVRAQWYLERAKKIAPNDPRWTKPSS